MGMSHSAQGSTEGMLLAVWDTFHVRNGCKCSGGTTQLVSDGLTRVFGNEVDCIHQTFQFQSVTCPREETYSGRWTFVKTLYGI